MTQHASAPYCVVLQIGPYGYQLDVLDQKGVNLVTLTSEQISRGIAEHGVDLNVLWDRLPSYEDLNDAIDSLYGEAFEVASALYSEHRSEEDE